MDAASSALAAALAEQGIDVHDLSAEELQQITDAINAAMRAGSGATSDEPFGSHPASHNDPAEARSLFEHVRVDEPSSGSGLNSSKTVDVAEPVHYPGVHELFQEAGAAGPIRSQTSAVEVEGTRPRVDAEVERGFVGPKHYPSATDPQGRRGDASESSHSPAGEHREGGAADRVGVTSLDDRCLSPESAPVDAWQQPLSVAPRKHGMGGADELPAPSARSVPWHGHAAAQVPGQRHPTWMGSSGAPSVRRIIPGGFATLDPSPGPSTAVAPAQAPSTLPAAEGEAAGEAAPGDGYVLVLLSTLQANAEAVTEAESELRSVVRER
jgi:hypothetical protein